jgi:hypothetical protein
MSYEKDKLDSYVTSASLSTALAPYATSASVSSAIAAAVGSIDLSAYVSSNSLSAAVATDALTVRGAAAVSATLSAGAVTVAGQPLGVVLLGYDAGTNKSVFAFSGSWSDFCILHLQMFYAQSSGGFPVSIYTDGGTTPILSLGSGSAPASSSAFLECRVYGGDDQPVKLMDTFTRISTTLVTASNSSRTATAGFVNCLRVSLTTTASYAFAALYGHRKA